jgi:hypothetical protein
VSEGTTSIPVVIDCPSAREGRALNEERVVEDLVEVELLEVLELADEVDEDVAEDVEVELDVDARELDEVDEDVRSALGS